jgi:hypothetical protein
MSKAALWGKSVGYSEYDGYVTVETNDGRVAAINMDTFNHLYFRLDRFTAALKEDCIEYVIYETNLPLACYPDWFIEAYDNGYIYEEEDYSDFIFYCKHGDIVMGNGSVVLMNFKGELNYMERYQFDKYYDILGD